MSEIERALSLSEGNAAARGRIEAYAKRLGLPLPYVKKSEPTIHDEYGEMFHHSLHAANAGHTVMADCILYDPTLAPETELATVHKAYNPVSQDFVVEKAITNEDGTVTIEGWISTPHKDLDKDIVEPECFLGDTFKGYFQRGAPVSSNHELTPYPVGHLQKAVLTRDGAILQEATHPNDPQDFLDGPGDGTGWYGRGIIDGQDASRAIRKGNVRSFSWIGNLAEYTPTVGGGKRYKRVDPLIETTIAAYPVNTRAVMRIAKAYGLTETKE